MGLPSCQKQKPIVYKQIVTDLLKWNNYYVTPNKDYSEVARYLSSLGFVSLREYYFIICANESDEFDLPYVIDPYCNNKLEISNDYDEDCYDPIMCDLCERYIFPDTHKKQRYYALDVTINRLKIIEWFEKQLENFNWNKVTVGAYYVIIENSLVSLIIPECCSDKSYLTIDKLRINPTALISFEKDNLKPLLNLYTVSMASLICQNQTLNEVLNEAIEKGIPELLPNVSFQALNCYPYIPLQHIRPTPLEKVLQLQIKNNNICVSNIEVIDKQSKSGNIFFVLLEQFLQDFKEGVSPKQYKTLNVEEIADRLKNIFDVEQQIRKPINRMQKTIAEKLAKSGLNVKRDDVIQTLPWLGIDTKKYGYRLNPFILVLKK